LIWNTAHLRRLPHDYEAFYNQHRPHRALGQAASLAAPAGEGHRSEDLPHPPTTCRVLIGGRGNYDVWFGARVDPVTVSTTTGG